MILAFESSCDETAMALVDAYGKVVLNCCLSQIELHNRYGGVVPELASRSHFDILEELSLQLQKAEKDKTFDRSQVQSVACTMGPGLIGPLLVGSNFARGIASAWSKDFRGVHHLRGHLASVLLDSQLDEKYPGLTLVEKAQKIFPALVLLVSGGHCLLMLVSPQLEARILKTTSDDAAGECFDKCAKLMGLPYPGGPSIQKEALLCTSENEKALSREWAAKLPRPKSEEGFSFAGLKTAFRLLLEKDSRAKSNRPALCKALEETIADSLLRVVKNTDDFFEGVNHFICCGGVAANVYLREKLKDWAEKKSLNFYTVPFAYATDNAAMIAAAAWVQASKLNEKQVFTRGHLE
jgi:N6-L-threonylcarbamoyladenine synthase